MTKTYVYVVIIIFLLIKLMGNSVKEKLFLVKFLMAMRSDITADQI